MAIHPIPAFSDRKFNHTLFADHRSKNQKSQNATQFETLDRWEDSEACPKRNSKINAYLTWIIWRPTPSGGTGTRHPSTHPYSISSTPSPCTSGGQRVDEPMAKRSLPPNPADRLAYISRSIILWPASCINALGMYLPFTLLALPYLEVWILWAF